MSPWRRRRIKSGSFEGTGGRVVGHNRYNGVGISGTPGSAAVELGQGVDEDGPTAIKMNQFDDHGSFLVGVKQG
jgi:hypothetical protein